MFRKRRYAGILVVALILAVTVAGVAMASSNPQANPGKTNYFQDFLAKFEANLGVDQDKVTAALDATKKQMFDEAVQKGYLTQQQADKIVARKNGNLGWLAEIQAKKHKFMERKCNHFNDMAKALGINPDQLKAEFKAGKKLPQIVADHGLTIEQFHQKMLEIKKEALANAVSEGKLTKKKADQIIQNMEQRLNNPAPKTGN